jgi:hypothetical protein
MQDRCRWSPDVCFHQKRTFKSLEARVSDCLLTANSGPSSQQKNQQIRKFLEWQEPTKRTLFIDSLI